MGMRRAAVRGTVTLKFQNETVQDAHEKRWALKKAHA